MLKIGDCVLNQETLLVTYEDKAIDLRPKEFSLLHKLLSYPNKIFTRQNLMDEIWGYESEADPRTVDVHIKRLREKLSEIPAFDIQTVRGLGYKAVLRA
jgi:DNA-binding response OmpR family regulator